MQLTVLCLMISTIFDIISLSIIFITSHLYSPSLKVNRSVVHPFFLVLTIVMFILYT